MNYSKTNVSHEGSTIQLKPVVSYPRTAETGKTYLLTIDVQLADKNPWPYQEEEFEISFLLETAPFFTHIPLGEHEPGIVLHRFGGTYGAAEYLLTASEQEVAKDKIRITLLNQWGLPITQLQLDCEVKQSAQAQETQSIVLSQRRDFIETNSYSTLINDAKKFAGDKLNAAGWSKKFVSNIRLKTPQSNKQIAYRLLRLTTSLPAAILYSLQTGEELISARNHLGNAVRYLAISFAYIIINNEDILEVDYTFFPSPKETIRAELPTRLELQQRWFSTLQLTDNPAADALMFPYQESRKPHYYQEAAINQTVIQILRALRGLQKPRILLILAAGTGKTLITFQILWKLKQARCVRNILFLADRSYILDQAANVFAPFHDRIVRATGDIDFSHDIIFGTYQWLTHIQDSKPRYENYPTDYFDLIVIDECHRGSARENSIWRGILEYFSQAIQIGLTATPIDSKDIQTNKYFGAPIYTYTLFQGIQDGYLAPYSVHNVEIESELEDEGINPLYTEGDMAETVKAFSQGAMRTNNVMRRYSKTIAEHLSLYLQRTNRQAKTIVFCVDNDHANQMRIELEKACFSWIRAGDIVRIVSDDGSEGDLALRLFCDPKESRPIIVTTSKLLAADVDIPTCENVVLARGVGSPVEFMQIIGCGTRLFPPNKTRFTILDYSGASKYFIDPDFDGTPELFETEQLMPSRPINKGQSQLSLTIKSVRDLLRKDAGLSGDADRLPQLTWLLLLKYLDDFEVSQEGLLGNEYIPVLEKNYRWRDWAVGENLVHQRNGDELLKFVNNDLIPYLGKLGGKDDRDIRTVIGTIFRETYNRLRSGHILRDVVDKISTINFNSSDDTHAVSLFYETMLKEMRDAAGDSGEFYTPRPVVRFIIERLQPRLGEIILDPACGTAGFLVEAYEQLKGQINTSQQKRRFEDDLRGIEKKSMPYLLAVMNMLLHGIDLPNIRQYNSLAANTQDLQGQIYVDMIATNPPFGGEEERGIVYNFPGIDNFPSDDNFPGGIHTSETALLFVQYIMAALKRPGGRCGIVLPNGFLFGSGAATKLKRRLLTHFNLHTIVRLLGGVFSPYTGIPTNILFFESDGNVNGSERNPATKEVWYYEVPLPEGRRSYSKTRPLEYEEFQGCIEWWQNRIENEYAWKVEIKQLLANNYNLDLKNPHNLRNA